MIGLQVRQVDFSYYNGLVIDNVSLSVEAGEMVGLLGPNGSGKTTLLKLASGVISPGRGEVMLNGSDMIRMNRKTIARHIAVVPQRFDISFAFTAAEVVTLGRIPFLKPFAEESEADRKLVDDALKEAGISELRERRFDELSGGERQKVIMAMALAQEPRLLLLDEPTTHLDICHQVEVLELVKRLRVEQGLTVIAAMHDLNLASLYFSRLVLLKKGKVLADGLPADVLTREMLEEVFSTPVHVETHPLTGLPHIMVLPKNSGVEMPQG